MNGEPRLAIRRALVSVFDKRGLEGLAAALAAAGVEVVSTGSTAATLEGHGVPRVEVLGWGESRSKHPPPGGGAGRRGRAGSRAQ